MYAFAASGKNGIVATQAELNKELAIYPYAKWHYCKTREEGLKWLRSNQRGMFGVRPYMFGSTGDSGVLQVRYFIKQNAILYNLDTSRIGDMKISPRPEDGVLVDNRMNLIKVKVTRTNLNNDIISHHCIAIRRILTIIGEYCDVCLTLPDMSVYIALTKYSGPDALIRKTQDFILQRLGGVSYTVDNIYNRCL